MPKNNETDSKKMTTDEKMETIAYNFINLYDRWSEDRLVASKNDAKSAELVKEFTKQIEYFAKLAPVIQEGILMGIKKIFSNVDERINQAITDVAKEKVDQPLEKLKRAARDANDYLQAHKQEVIDEKSRSFWKAVGIAICVSIVSAVVIVRILLPGDIYNLTSAQMNDMQNGHLLSSVWPKLSSSDRDTIKGALKKAISEE